MTSRERVLSAIEHREPDRVPLDLGATPSSGISAIAYTRLADYLGVEESRTRVYDVVQELAQPEDWAIDRFGVDVLDIGRMFNNRESDWYPVELSDGSQAYYPAWFHPEQEGTALIAKAGDGTPIAKKPKGATFFDQTYFPYIDGYPDSYDDLPDAMNKVLWQAMVHSPWDHAGEDDYWEQLRNAAIKLKENSDRALMIVAGSNLFEWGTFLRRMDNFLMDIYTEPDKVEGLLDALMEVHLAGLEKVCETVGDVADVLRFGDDLGLDTGPFMAPEIYRKIFKPRHTRLCEYVHKNSGMKTFLHSCGSVYKLIPDLVEAGYDVLNPVQTNTVDMEPERLKKEFGGDICFWGGGADTREVLNSGTAEQVRDHVKKRLDVFMPGGGFVFNTVHNIMPDVPPENIVAMYETVAQYR
ncbi:MAG: methyltransferase [Spirochaetales bacterium]|nr:methyltransferase [Spirochaetales bacterium]MCF7937418.1 methyltransferase [Spirochaetales bacterium]